MNGLPPINHVLYIPLMLSLGFYVGWSLGTKSIQKRWDRAERRRLREEEEAP